LPLKEQAGKLDTLDLAADQGLVELCHIVIYPEGYAAAEFNFSGPRIKRLSDYLYAKHNELNDKVTFLPLFQRDIVSLVEQMATINLMELTGQPGSASLLKEADQGLSDAVKTLGRVGAEKTVRLGLFSDGGHKSKLHTLAIRLAKVIRANRAEAEATLRKLRVQGFNTEGKIDAVDLLEQHLISFKLIERVREDSKALSSESAYKQIDAAYEQLKDKLEEASVGQELF
jgi:hypothetical protein